MLIASIWYSEIFIHFYIVCSSTHMVRLEYLKHLSFFYDNNIQNPLL
jgi:hypothetical protein